MTAIGALAALGFIGGKWARPSSGVELSEIKPTSEVAVPDWHVGKATVEALDVLEWSEELPLPAFDLKLAEALETMPIANLRSLAQQYRDIAWRQYGTSVFPGYDRVHDALIRRAPWIAVEDLLAGAEWERAILRGDDDDLDLEGLLSTALASLYQSEPERVLAVFGNLKSRWVIEDTSIFQKFDGQALLEAMAAARESPAGQALDDAEPQLFLSRMGEAKEGIFAQLVKDDPDAALETALADQDERTRTGRIWTILNAATDPLPLAKKLLEAGALEISQLGRFLPEQALNWARARPEGDKEAIAVAKDVALGVFNTSDDYRFVSARKILEEFLGTTESTRFVERYWEYRSPTDLASLKALPRSKAGMRGFETWVDYEKDPQMFRSVATTTDVLSDLPPTASGIQKSLRFAARWAALPGEGEVASEWANQIAASGMRAQAVENAVSSWAEFDPAAAASWALRLEPLELRARALNGAIQKLGTVDPDIARQMLQQSQLPVEMVKRFSNLDSIGSHE